MAATVLAFVAEVKRPARATLDHVLAHLGRRAAQPPFRPFSAVRTLHFASLVVFDSPGFEPTLVFECNFDGELDAFIDALLAAAANDLHAVLECCHGYAPAAGNRGAHIATFLRRHVILPNAYHVGNFGRTRDCIEDERELCAELDRGVDRALRHLRVGDPDRAYALMRRVAESTPVFERLDRPAESLAFERFVAYAQLVAGGVLALVLMVVLIVPLLISVFVLRRQEQRDVPMDPRSLDLAHDACLAAGEDQQQQNHLASITIVKPGWLRRTTLRVVLWAVNRLARTSTHGTLDGIPSIHFAHWSLLNGGRRLLFLSNYDGGWSGYLDDFVDHANRGLTAIWSNTCGFPKTRFLAFGGASDRIAFKAFARMQQTSAAVWYSAYPNLTVQQIDANTALREGLVSRPSDPDIVPWLHRFAGGNAASESKKSVRPSIAAAERYGDEPPRGQQLEVADIQRLVVSSHSRLPCSAFLLLRVQDADSARRWLARQMVDVTTAEDRHNTDPCALQMAFTHRGLERLGLAAETLSSFPAPFVEGMACDRYARLLGDVDEDSPREWCWGSEQKPVDVLLLLYADTMHRLRGEIARRTPVQQTDGLALAYTLPAGRAPDDNREHFGFLDGVGQPVIEGSGLAPRQLARTSHASVIPAGEFLLGYKNADGVPPLGPVVPPETTGYETLPPLPRDTDAPDRRDFGRNGTYLVFRHLEQDVAGFWRSVTRAADRLWPDDPTGPARLAAKMIGRWESGAPLVSYPMRDPVPQINGKPEKECPENEFDFSEDDPDGLRCPLGAHIRRANPRDSLGGPPAEARAAVNRRRLLRRGRSYGDRIVNRLEPDGKKRGLFFICLNADIERQFVFVQRTWINNPDFHALHDEVDALVGVQGKASCRFTIPHDPLREHVPHMRSFVRVRGGAFWFLPGIKALKVILHAT